jgi:hypothetical protein
MFRFGIPAILVSLLLTAPATAAKVRVWHHHAPSDFEKARFHRAVISSEGALRLARQLRPLASLDATQVWGVVEDRAGNLLVATGNEGKIFKLAADGRISVFYKCEDSQVLCLALAPDGTLYAGTGPTGMILRVREDGRGGTFCKTGASYVWSLVFDHETDTLFAGTGPKGCVYAVSSAGKSRVFYKTKQDHILSLARGHDRSLYAGTDKEGLIYRIDPSAKGFVLYSVPQAEVRSLLVTENGVFAGTSTPVRHLAHNSSRQLSEGLGFTSSPHLGSLSVASKESTESGYEAEDREPPSSSNDSSSNGSAGKSLPAPPPPAVGRGENSLYYLGNDGTVRELFREKTLMLSLLRQNGRIFVGTGMNGQLFEVDEATKERSELARLDNGQILCLHRRRDGSIILGTGDPGRLYVLEDKFATKGTVVSEVLDAKLVSKWGALHWSADTPPGTHASVAVRSGNTPEPSETWSNWSAENTDAEQSLIACPPARFLQYRVTLSTEDSRISPALHGITLRYMTTNQAPEVTSIHVPDLDGANLDNPKKLHIKWTATDPNEDDLTYALYVRKEEWKNWVQLEDHLEHTDYDWDTTTTPSGIYQVKIVASDSKDNPPQDALTGARLSRPFAVAHNPPAVWIKLAALDGERAVLEAGATDPLVRLTDASFCVNGKRWVNVFPTDGIFDSKQESFRFKTESLKAGTYVVVLRVRDAAGNVGSSDIVFTIRQNAGEHQ